MARQRTTRDTWELWTNYGYGWECECIEFTRQDIRARLKEYRENTHAQLQVKKRRETLTAVEKR